MSTDTFSEVWKYAPAIAILFFVIWAGSKGWWYWGEGTRLLVQQLERDRDQWKHLALVLLKHSGIEVNEVDEKK